MNADRRGREETCSVAKWERIDRVCLEFEAAWKTGMQPQIEQFLGGWEGADHSALLRELLLLDLDYRQRCQQPASVAEYQSRFPQDAAIIAEVFDTVSRGRDQQATPPAVSRADRSASAPLGALGDYELLEVLGEGGMGVVYRARQRSADRVVALKVIRPDRLAAADPHSRQEALNRFRTEAQSAARLEHDQIVTVYDVGEIAGQPYFSMRYIEGESLDQVLRNGPLEGRAAAGLIEPVARAVHFAHEQGILHRDLKPRNILLDGQRRPHVADFGLAKPLAAAEGVTQTGEVIGTPAYMPPEQARGDEVGPAGDTYSLGATLYEAITGRPPFRAATVAETLRQVLDREPVSPRHLNPAVARDLETICMKCLEKEPPRRYGSASALADELGRFLRGDPILARPISRPARAWRWCERNPMPAGLGAGLLAVLLSVAVIAPIVALRQTDLASVAQERLEKQVELAEQADRSRALAEARSEKLKNVTTQLLFHVATEGEIPTTLFPLRAELMEESLRVYEELYQEEPGEELLLKLAETYGYLGTGYHALGRTAEAEQALRKSLEHLVKLAQSGESRYERLRLRGAAQLADFYREIGRHREAIALLEKARPQAEKLCNAEPDNLEARFCLCTMDYTLGSAYNEVSPRDVVAAEQAFRRAAGIETRLGSPGPEEFVNRSRFTVAAAYLELGKILAARAEEAVSAESRAARRTEARQMLLKARTQTSEIRGRWENTPPVVSVMSDVLLRLAEVTEDDDQAYSLLRDAYRLIKKAATYTPAVPRYKYDLSVVLDRQVRWHERRGDFTRGRDMLEEAIRHLGEAVSLAPAVPQYQRALRDHYRALALADEKVAANKPQSQVSTCAAAAHFLFLAADAMADDPALTSQRREESLADLAGHVQRLQHKADQAAQTRIEKALTVLCMASCPIERLRDHPRAMQLAEQIAAELEGKDATTAKDAPGNHIAWCAVGVARYRAGQWARAVESLRKARDMAAEPDPTVGLFLAMALWNSGDPASARKACEDAVRIASQKERLLHLRPFLREAKRLLEGSRARQAGAK